MKKILVRTGMSPFEDVPLPEILAYNRIGNNVGNLVYAYSIYRALMTDGETEMVPTKYLVSRLDVEKINEGFDSFVIPLADFIREDRKNEIKAMTKLINQLKIPCTIVGIGIRADYEYEKTGVFFQDDKVAYRFLEAVLNKSAMIGVRGEITGEYLKKLGFVPEKHYTVIGCPSFYTWGEDLDVKEINFSNTSQMAFNNGVLGNDQVQAFLQRTTEQFPNFHFYPQTLGELKTLYLGKQYRDPVMPEGYPRTIQADVYKKDRVRFHTHVSSWMEDLKKKDFSIGIRLHGNVLSALSGTPAIWIPHDARMRELVDYHNLPHIRATEINEKTDVLELFSKIDYKSLLKGHKERFQHYLGFLEKNGISHIFKEGKNPKESPFDRKIKEMKIEEKDFSVTSIWNCGLEEVMRRMDEYDELSMERKREDLEIEQGIKKGLREKNASIRKEVDGLKKKVAKKEGEIQEVKKELKEAKKNLVLAEEQLRKSKEELDEAKKTLPFLVRRKIGKMIRRREKEERD